MIVRQQLVLHHALMEFEYVLARDLVLTAFENSYGRKYVQRQHMISWRHWALM